VDVPEDLTGAKVNAFVWNGSAWDTYPGVGNASGTFTIPGVPAGLFLVDVNGVYLYTTARVLDLGADVGGRSTAVYGSATDTVGGTVGGLVPWQPGDLFEWNDPNAGGGAYGFAGSDPATGATSLSGQASAWFGGLIDGAEGDVLYALQLSAKQAGTTQYAALTGVASFPSVEQVDGTPVEVTGALTPVDLSKTISFDLLESQFSSLVSAVNPSAQGGGVELNVVTMPGAATAGWVGYNVNLLYLYTTTDVALSGVPYGNPFPSSWGELAIAADSWFVSYTAPGATSSSIQSAFAYTTMPASQASLSPIRPGVTPVRDPKVGGASAFDALTGIGVTPVLSWTPPAVGAPTAYEVTIYQAANAGGSTSIDYVAEIVTTTTSLPLPPGLLQDGSAYVFVVTAVVSPIDSAVHPFRLSPTTASADALSGLMTP
jgi:hypothetical protein